MKLCAKTFFYLLLQYQWIVIFLLYMYLSLSKEHSLMVRKLTLHVQLSLELPYLCLRKHFSFYVIFLGLIWLLEMFFPRSLLSEEP